MIAALSMLFCMSAYSQSKLVVDYIYSGNVKYKVDTYPKDVKQHELNATDVSRQAAAKFNSKHSLIMPDDMVPIGILKSKFAEVKKLLGQNCIVLDNLNCDKPECLENE